MDFEIILLNRSIRIDTQITLMFCEPTRAFMHRQKQARESSTPRCFSAPNTIILFAQPRQLLQRTNDQLRLIHEPQSTPGEGQTRTLLFP